MPVADEPISIDVLTRLRVLLGMTKTSKRDKDKHPHDAQGKPLQILFNPCVLTSC